MSKSTSYKTDLGVQQAERALQTTRATIATMWQGPTDEKDKLLMLLVAREQKQAKTLKDLTDKAPS